MGAGCRRGLSPTGDQGMVSSGSVLVLQQLCGCPWVQRWSPSAQTGPAPSLWQSPAYPQQHCQVFNPSREGFCLWCPGSRSRAEVGLNETSAALKFPSKYLIREMFHFNNKWAEYQETRVLAKYIYSNVFIMRVFLGLPFYLRSPCKWKKHPWSCKE